jgi:hypothetical protein
MRNDGLLAGAAAVLVSLVVIVMVVAAWFGTFLGDAYLVAPMFASVSLGFLTPVCIIALRHQVRVTRVRLIKLFADNFAMSEKKNASFEFVRGKYYVDLPVADASSSESPPLPRYPFSIGADWLLLISAIPMMAFATAGIFVLLAPYDAFGAGKPIGKYLMPSLLALGGLDFSKPVFQGGNIEKYYHREVLTIASLAFAGAYIYALKLLLRAVSTFDLNSVTFLRCFTHMVLATLLATVIWRFCTQSYEAFFPHLPLRNLFGGLPLQNVVADNSTTDSPNGVSFPIWLIIAFAIGFIPDAGLQWLLRKSKLDPKPRYNSFDDLTMTIPLTILDGIDYLVAFRLEESNVFDVQNLATANPIMLHIESPYGIYQSIDWVAQAQLCTLVGPERFMYLKRFYIRTIFDLEKALLGPNANSKVKTMVLLTLMMPDDLRRTIERRIGARGFAQPKQAPVALATAPAAALVGEEPYREAQSEIVIALADGSIDDNLVSWMDDDFINHLGTIMVDDLHIRRLRQIWNHIVDKLGPDSDSLRERAAPAG